MLGERVKCSEIKEKNWKKRKQIQDDANFGVLTQGC